MAECGGAAFRNVSRFRWLLITISDDLEALDVTKLRCVLKGRISEKFRNTAEPLDILDGLEEANLVSETNLEFLKNLLANLPRRDILSDVEQYEREMPKIIKKMNFPAELLYAQNVFVGREKELNGIRYKIQSSQHGKAAPVIVIHGMQGMGKTALATEACARLSVRRTTIKVELRGLSPNKDSLFKATMFAFGGSYSEIDMAILRELISNTEEGAVIIFDNADSFTNAPKETENMDFEHPATILVNFINEIRDANDLMVIIVTAVRTFQDIDLPFPFHDVNVQRMSADDSIRLINRCTGRTNLLEKDCRDLARTCGYHPLSMKVIASKLQDSSINPIELIKLLSNKLKTKLFHVLKASQLESVEMCLENATNSLKMEEKMLLMMLSIIPGSFDTREASGVLRNVLTLLPGLSNQNLFLKLSDTECKSITKAEVRLCLDYLVYRSLIEKKGSTREHEHLQVRQRYELHPLIRLYCNNYCQNSENTDDCLLESWRLAEENFIHYFSKHLHKIAELVNSKYFQAMAKLDINLANFVYVLNLQRQVPEQLKQGKTNIGKVGVFCMFVELVYDSWQEKQAYYHDRAVQAQKAGNQVLSAEFRSWEASESLKQNAPQWETREILEQSRTTLDKLPVNDRNSQLTKATYKHVKALECKANGVFREGIDLLMECVDIRKNLLGDNVLTARAYCDLGSLHFSKSKAHESNRISCLKSALKFHSEAVSMRKRIGPNHFDMPIYIQNLGACHVSLGQYERAMEFLEEALNLDDKLKLSGFARKSDILYSMSVCRNYQCAYDDALSLVEKCLSTRLEAYGRNQPQVASAYYLKAFTLRNQEKYEESFDMAYETAFNIECAMMSEGRKCSNTYNLLKLLLEQLCTLRGISSNSCRKEFQEIEKIYAEKAKREGDDGGSSSTSSSSSSSTHEPKAKKFCLGDDTSDSSSDAKEEDAVTDTGQSQGNRFQWKCTIL